MPDLIPPNANAIVSHVLSGPSFFSARLGRALETVEDHARITEQLPPEEVEAYWTPERMAAAKPFALKEVPQEKDEDEKERLKLRDFLKGQLGDHGKDSHALNESAPFESLLTVAFDTAKVPNVAVFPYAAVGKIYATVNGVDHVGSAWVIANSAIITAGHCVFSEDGNVWVSRLAFAPQFNGTATKGVWAATSVHTLAGWIGQGPQARAFDLGAAILSKPVAPVTGTIGWLANQPVNQGPYHSVGYPAVWLSNQFAFDGNLMWRCNGPYAGGTAIIAMANNMTGGCSGGPWLVKKGAAIYAAGLNGYRSSDNPNLLMSPYFGQGFINLVHAVS